MFFFFQMKLCFNKPVLNLKPLRCWWVFHERRFVYTFAKSCKQELKMVWGCAESQSLRWWVFDEICLKTHSCLEKKCVMASPQWKTVFYTFLHRIQVQIYEKKFTRFNPDWLGKRLFPDLKSLIALWLKIPLILRPGTIWPLNPST